jgi:hypothetical protein
MEALRTLNSPGNVEQKEELEASEYLIKTKYRTITTANSMALA